MFLRIVCIYYFPSCLYQPVASVFNRDKDRASMKTFPGMIFSATDDSVVKTQHFAMSTIWVPVVLFHGDK